MSLASGRYFSTIASIESKISVLDLSAVGSILTRLEDLSSSVVDFKLEFQDLSSSVVETQQELDDLSSNVSLVVASVSDNIQDLKDYYSRTFYANASYASEDGGRQNFTAVGATMATWTFNNVATQNADYYMEFDLNLERILIGSSTNDDSRIIAAIYCNIGIGGNNNFEKVYNFTHAQGGTQFVSDRIRYLARLDSNIGEFNPTFIFTFKVISADGNPTFSFDAGTYTNLASMKLTKVRSGDAIIPTTNTDMF